MGLPLGQVINESAILRCLGCGEIKAISELWRLIRFSFEQEFYFCNCDRAYPLAVRFPDDGRIELNEKQAEVVSGNFSEEFKKITDEYAKQRRRIMEDLKNEK